MSFQHKDRSLICNFRPAAFQAFPMAYVPESLKMDEKEFRKNSAWQKAMAVSTHDSRLYKKDRFGNWIAWIEYGQTTTYGWEIDHNIPISKGGADTAENLVALHWKANRAKSSNLI